MKKLIAMMLCCALIITGVCCVSYADELPDGYYYESDDVIVPYMEVPEVLPYANLDNLYCWYSDATTASYWTTIPSSIYVNKLNHNSSFDFIAAMRHAVSQWNTALGASMSVVETSSTIESRAIECYGGTTNEIRDTMVFSSVNEGVNGLTWYKNSSYATTVEYNGNHYNISTISKVRIYVVDNGRTISRYKKTCTHELGHALGWRGHSSVGSDIMYGSGSTVTSLTARDKNHLRQIYDLMG